jgi:hypothetical protein
MTADNPQGEPAPDAAPKRGRKPGFYVYRIFEGFQTLYIGKGSGRRLKSQMKRFEADGEVIEWCQTDDQAFTRERHWIAKLLPTENRHPGGSGGRCSRHPVPREYRNLYTPQQWRRIVAAGEKEIEKIRQIGTRKYCALILLACEKSKPGILPASKLEMIRQVACG